MKGFVPKVGKVGDAFKSILEVLVLVITVKCFSATTIANS